MRKEFEAMIMRLGLNVQEAIHGAKDDVVVECRDLVRDVEMKNDKNISIMANDLNNFGVQQEN